MHLHRITDTRTLENPAFANEAGTGCAGDAPEWACTKHTPFKVASLGRGGSQRNFGVPVAVRALAALLIFAVLGLGVAGCGGSPTGRERDTPDAAGVFEGASTDRLDEVTWRIVLGAVGEANRDDAAGFAAGLESATGLRGIELGERAGSPILVYGRYGSPDAADAQRDLARVREIEVDGARPFVRAFFLPPSLDAARGRNAAYDLRNARQRFGADAVYTLQVGAYSRGDGRPPTPENVLEFRRLAERAVEQLRAEGQPAFYYHGPSGSTVTVGVYGPEDHDPSQTPPLESQRLRAARAEFPNALLNGLGVKQRLRDRNGRIVERLQPSFLVAVPR